MAFSAMLLQGLLRSTAYAQPITHRHKTMTENHDPATIGYADGKYVLPPLPYAYDALEPLMDEQTVRIHHDKHHAAYVAGANAAAEKLRLIAEGKLEESATTHWVRALSFNVSGHVLHTLFWMNLCPGGAKSPTGPLMTAINEKFGSFQAMMLLVKAAASGGEGSGWGILGLDPVSKTPVICGAEKHQNIEIPGLIPLLACDVWEHAYYLKHQNARAAYIDDFCKLINWTDVAHRYACAMSCRG